MALFGFLKENKEKQLRRHAARVANKRAQSPDRWESIRVLSEMKDEPEAIAALLQRFTYITDPSITDQEEKDAVFDAIVAAKDTAIAPVRRFMERAESIGWPLKIIENLCDSEGVVTELLELLKSMDTEYERDPQRKIQILAALEERSDARIAEAVGRFTDDVNESARFHAVGALFEQDNVADFRELLEQRLRQDESMRVRARILDGFAANEWALSSEDRKLPLPNGYRLSGKGVPQNV